MATGTMSSTNSTWHYHQTTVGTRSALYMPIYQYQTSPSPSGYYVAPPMPRMAEVELVALANERWQDMDEETFEKNWAVARAEMERYRKEKLPSTHLVETGAPQKKARAKRKAK